MIKIFNNLWNRIHKNKLIKNFFILLCSDGIVSIITMINTIMVIRSIGTDQNGMLIMIQSFTAVISTIFCFSSFNGLITYLPKHINNNDNESIKDYIKQSLLLELIGGIIAFVIGELIVSLIAKIMGWDGFIVTLIRIYLITTVVNISGVASAVIRIFDKFKYLSMVNIAIAISRIIFYSVGFVAYKHLIYFVIVEILIDLLSKVLYLYFMFKVLKERKIEKVVSSNISFDKGFVKFSFLTNISQTLDVPVTYLGIFIINKYLGYSSSTVYNLIEKVGNIFGKLSKPIQQIIYPQITTWVAENKINESIKFSKRIFYIINGVGVLASVIVLTSYELWLDKFLPEYNFEVIISLVLYLLFVSFANSTQSIHAYFLAFKLARLNLYILFLVNVIYIIILFVFTIKFGIIGVIISRVIQSILICSVKLIVIIKFKYLKLA